MVKTDQVDFDKAGGLVPVVIQDAVSDEVYMLGYMNKEALNKTRETGWVYFYSRSKNRLWMKGEESNNRLKVVEISTDCDNDSLLIKVELHGQAVCHTGHKSCFYTKLEER